MTGMISMYVNDKFNACTQIPSILKTFMSDGEFWAILSSGTFFVEEPNVWVVLQLLCNLILQCRSGLSCAKASHEPTLMSS